MTMQTPLIITDMELPTKTAVDYVALAELVRELGDLLLPLDSQHQRAIRNRLYQLDVFSRLWSETNGGTPTHLLLTTKRVLSQRRVSHCRKRIVYL